MVLVNRSMRVCTVDGFLVCCCRCRAYDSCRVLWQLRDCCVQETVQNFSHAFKVENAIDNCTQLPIHAVYFGHLQNTVDGQHTLHRRADRSRQRHSTGNPQQIDNGNLRFTLGGDVANILATSIPEGVVYSRPCAGRREHTHLFCTVGHCGPNKEHGRNNVGGNFQKVTEGKDEGRAKAPSFGIRIKSSSHATRPTHTHDFAECVLEDPLECRRERAQLTGGGFDAQSHEERLCSKNVEIGVHKSLDNSPFHELIVILCDSSR